MIRWCSYCQSFLGEVCPFEDFSITHTICDVCMSKGRDYIGSQVSTAREISDFYNRFRKAAIAGKSISIDEILDEGLLLGLKDIDLCVGIIQPILYEIGGLWKNGQITIAHEHSFTEFAEQLIKRLKERLSSKAISEKRQKFDVLLVCADGNYHTVGLRVIDMAISELGLTTKVITPGVPSSEVFRLINEFQPSILGVSLSLNEQVQQVVQIASDLDGNKNCKNIKILAGGNGIRNQETFLKSLPNVLIAPNDIALLKKLVANHIKQNKCAA